MNIQFILFKYRIFFVNYHTYLSCFNIRWIPCMVLHAYNYYWFKVYYYSRHRFFAIKMWYLLHNLGIFDIACLMLTNLCFVQHIYFHVSISLYIILFWHQVVYSTLSYSKEKRLKFSNYYFAFYYENELSFVTLNFHYYFSYNYFWLTTIHPFS